MKKSENPSVQITRFIGNHQNTLLNKNFFKIKAQKSTVGQIEEV